MLKVLIVAVAFLALFALWIWRGLSIARDEERLADELAASADEDAHLLAVAERAWETGNPVVGTVDEAGNLTLLEIERERIQRREVCSDKSHWKHEIGETNGND